MGPLKYFDTSLPSHCISLFSVSLLDPSYDAVRRTGWSNNMHSGKGEAAAPSKVPYAAETRYDLSHFDIMLSV